MTALLPYVSSLLSRVSRDASMERTKRKLKEFGHKEEERVCSVVNKLAHNDVGHYIRWCSALRLKDRQS